MLVELVGMNSLYLPFLTTNSSKKNWYGEFNIYSLFHLIPYIIPFIRYKLKVAPKLNDQLRFCGKM